MSGKSLTDMASLKQQLEKRFKGARITLDPAARPNGVDYLDVVYDGHHVAVQWKAGQGYGLSCRREHEYGEQPEEIYQGTEETHARIVSLLLSKTFTSPPESVRLGELRRARGMSQEDLARQLDVRQAAVSKLEHRSDLLVSTVREVVESMGGKLHISAIFPDGMERRLEFAAAPAPATKARRSKQRP